MTNLVSFVSAFGIGIGRNNIVLFLAKIKEGLINTLYLQTAASAIFYYLYNEVAFLTLDNVAPVTHALGNTIKRVVIILASVVARIHDDCPGRFRIGTGHRRSPPLQSCQGQIQLSRVCVVERYTSSS